MYQAARHQLDPPCESARAHRHTLTVVRPRPFSSDMHLPSSGSSCRTCHHDLSEGEALNGPWRWASQQRLRWVLRTVHQSKAFASRNAASQNAAFHQVSTAKRGCPSVAPSTELRDLRTIRDVHRTGCSKAETALRMCRVRSTGGPRRPRASRRSDPGTKHMESILLLD